MMFVPDITFCPSKLTSQAFRGAEFLSYFCRLIRKPGTGLMTFWSKSPMHMETRREVGTEITSINFLSR